MGNTFPREIILYVSKKIAAVYSENETNSLASLLVEKVFKLTATQLMLNEQLEIAKENSVCLEQSIERLLKNEPIQHIFGEAEFYGRKFKVNGDVLIPRQETEELIQLIVDDNELEVPKILDIGTGSGCIACSLALEVKSAQVQAIDISEEALITAQRNADLLNAKVSFLKIDILKDSIPLKEFDIIVSNPPYVLDSERALMHKNVVDYDPGLALFVPDNDPLLFYKAIGDISRQLLRSGGKLYFEINEKFGVAVAQSLNELGYNQIKIHQDLNGKDRFVIGII
ncbi:MAG: release factor glutamine methyltransferase [Cyclobacteriaceae bacterium]|jgi:release factor glutamine methyltransferase